MSVKDALLNIINKYGLENQKRKLQEEVDELKEAIILFENGADNIEHVIEEMADVITVLLSIKEYYNISNNDLIKHEYTKQQEVNLQLEVDVLKETIILFENEVNINITIDTIASKIANVMYILMTLKENYEITNDEIRECSISKLNRQLNRMKAGK